MKSSIIIVTRNHCKSLAETLHSLSMLRVPGGLQVELLVVDNGSSDETHEVVGQFSHQCIKARRIVEPIAGQAHGRNLGLKSTDGELILFIDDDVRVTQDWLRLMITPMIHGQADAVAGGVRMAERLSRPWMTPLHRAWLAETGWLNDVETVGLVGANMGFVRAVLENVRGFNVNLGPGALGFGDDQLFAMQIATNGYRIKKQLDVCVEHHFDEERLKRSAWLAAAEARGRSQAYIGHHWLHWRSRLAKVRQLRSVSRLRTWRKRYPMPDSIEGCAETELLLLQECACLQAQLEWRNTSKSYHFNSHAKA